MGQLQATLILLARVCVGIPFILYGVMIVPFWGEYAQLLTAQNVPLPSLFMVIALIFLVVGGISVVLGYRARLGVVLLMVVLACATFTVGSVWQLGATPAPPDNWALWNNIAIFGGLLYLLTFGAGQISFDRSKSVD